MFLQDKKKVNFGELLLICVQKSIVFYPLSMKCLQSYGFINAFFLLIKKLQSFWFSQNLKFIASTQIGSPSECILNFFLFESKNKKLSSTSTLKFNNYTL